MRMPWLTKSKDASGHEHAADGRFGTTAGTHGAAEGQAIKKYGGLWGFEINGKLRIDKATPEDKAHIDALDSAIKSSPAKSKMITYRGLKTDPFGFVGARPGDVFADPGYTSTSASKSQGIGFGDKSLLVVHVPEKFPALSYERETGVAGEREWLLPRLSKLRVDRVEMSDGKPVYHVTPIGVADAPIRPKRMPLEDARRMARDAEAIEEDIPNHVLADYPELGKKDTRKSIRAPWLTKQSSFTGVSFGKYFINGQQVDEATYKAQADQRPNADLDSFMADDTPKAKPAAPQGDSRANADLDAIWNDTEPLPSSEPEPPRHPSAHNPEITYGHADDRDSDDKYFARAKKDAKKYTRQAAQLRAKIASMEGRQNSPEVHALNARLQETTAKLGELKKQSQEGKAKIAALKAKLKPRGKKPAAAAPALTPAKPTTVDVRPSAPTPAVPQAKPPMPMPQRTAAQRLAPGKNGPPPIPGKDRDGFVTPGTAYPPKLPAQPPARTGAQSPPLPHARTHQSALAALSAAKQANASGSGQQAAHAAARKAIEAHRQEGLRHIARLARQKHGATPKGKKVAMATFAKFNANLDRALQGLMGTMRKEIRLVWLRKSLFDESEHPRDENGEFAKVESRERAVAKLTKIAVGKQPTSQKRAAKGGEVGANGEDYRGGAFIATQDLPKKIKDKMKQLATGKVRVGMSGFAVPEPGMMSIVDKMGGSVFNHRDGKINQQYLDYIKASAEDRKMYEELAEKHRNGVEWVSVDDYPKIAGYTDIARLYVAGKPVPESLLSKVPESVRGRFNAHFEKKSIRHVITKAGRWITIGGKKGEDGKRSGGSPVYIENGKITRGHPSLTGKKIDNLKGEADHGTTRSQLAKSRGHAHAKLRKAAKKAGHNPDHVQALADEIREHRNAFSQERIDLLQHARAFSKNNHGVDLTRRGPDGFVGGKEDNHRHMDETAADAAKRFPGHFQPETAEGGGSHQDQLVAMLSEGNPDLMSHEDAFEQAMEHFDREKQPEADKDDDWTPWDDDDTIATEAAKATEGDYPGGWDDPIEDEKPADKKDDNLIVSDGAYGKKPPPFKVDTSISHEYGTPHFIFKTPDGKEIGELQLKLRANRKDMVTANLIVWPQFQRQGYATEFYRHAADWVNNAGVKFYTSQDRSKDALALHETLGSHGVIAKDGEIRFDKKLKPAAKSKASGTDWRDTAKSFKDGGVIDADEAGSLRSTYADLDDDERTEFARHFNVTTDKKVLPDVRDELVERKIREMAKRGDDGPTVNRHHKNQLFGERGVGESDDLFKGIRLPWLRKSHDVSGEARDESGKWTGGGASGDKPKANHAKHARKASKEAFDVSDSLAGFAADGETTKEYVRPAKLARRNAAEAIKNSDDPKLAAEYHKDAADAHEDAAEGHRGWSGRDVRHEEAAKLHMKAARRHRMAAEAMRAK
jgi:GNAT superfamily N-acetyltransferase